MVRGSAIFERTFFMTEFGFVRLDFNISLFPKFMGMVFCKVPFSGELFDISGLMVMIFRKFCGFMGKLFRNFSGSMGDNFTI